jgi:hypothetical protein
MRRWWEVRTDDWIDFEDGRILDKMVSDLESRRSSVLDVLHEGVDSALAYSGIDTLGTALMLIAPKDDIMAEALAMEGRVLERIDRQIRFAGQILCIGTDGIWETLNPRGEMSGHRRMKEIIRKKSHLPAAEIMTAIIDAVKSFRSGSRQEDDITLVIVKLTSLETDARPGKAGIED